MSIVIGAVAGVLGAILTIFLTPALQHYFWKFQRREELRLATINEANRLSAEFITKYMEEGRYKDPGGDFWQSFQTVIANVKALFSDEGYQEFEKMAAMMGPNLGPEYEKRDVYDFVVARDRALRVLYDDVGVRKIRPPWEWLAAQFRKTK